MVSPNLKLILLLALVGIVFVSVESAPKRPGKKSCNSSCIMSYEPVCAQDSSVKGSKPRTFGNSCTMDFHNCENDAHMEVIYTGECKNSGGVRLS